MTSAAQKSVPLSQIVKEVDLVINEINLIDSSAGLPKPKKLTITFESEISREIEGGLKILFFKAGGKKSVSRSSETTFNYDVVPIKGFDATLTQSLSLAIRDAYREVLKHNSETLTLSGFTVKVGFTLEKSKGIEGEYEFSPVTPSLSKTWTKKAVHSIEVEFSK